MGLPFAPGDRAEEIKELCHQNTGSMKSADASGCHVGCQVIDTSMLGPVVFHPGIDVGKSRINEGRSRHCGHGLCIRGSGI